MRGRSLKIVALLLLGTVALSRGLVCFSGSITVSDNLNQVLQADGKDCANTVKFCIVKNYTTPVSFTLGCEGDGVESFPNINCSNSLEGFANTDAGGGSAHTWTCCTEDLCNKPIPGLELIDIDAEDPESLRPACARSYVPWQFSEGTSTWVDNGTALPHLDRKDYFENRFEGNENATKVEELRGKVEVFQDDLRSKWTLGTQPPTAEQFIFTRDPSPPGCYRISGFIQEGFCGPRQEIEKNGEPPLYSLTGRESFGGKYEINTCAGSKTEALAIGNDFSSSGKHLTYIECFEALSASSLARDCSAMRGSYNIARLARNRRKLLPDCCANYVHTDEDTRRACLCNSRTRPNTVVCQEVCCCEDALTFQDADACRVLYEFIEMNQELEEHVNRQCCSTRMMSQCEQSDSHCSDTGFDSGKLESLHAIPMCCEHCYDFYDEICSYEGIQNGQKVFIQMKTKTNKPLLEAVCEQKGCRFDYPCSYEGFSGVEARAVPPSAVFLSSVALVAAVWASSIVV